MNAIRPMPQVEPNRPMGVTLPAWQWNVVLGLVARGPYAEVAEVLDHMAGQLRMAAHERPHADAGELDPGSGVTSEVGG